MTQLFNNKYRIPSARLRGWDYRSAGAYFVTICTHKRICWFGTVKKGEMHLSVIGKIIFDEWLKTAQIRPNVELDEFIVMPNHFHGILIIKNDTIVETTRRVVSTPQTPQTPQTLQPNSLGSIIGQFKSVCTKRIRNGIEPHFQWQARFYDHIIRNEGDANRIRQYIRNNPVKWQRDMNNPKPK